MNTEPQKYPTEKISLLKRRHEYGEVYTYIFQPANPITFTAGAYAHIRLLSLPEGTKRVHELSFASPPQTPELWFMIDSRSGSAYQQALKALAVGDTVELFKIKSHLTWPAPAPEVVMIAGGVGITPFRSMLLDAKERNLTHGTTLVQVASKAFLYGDELKGLASEHYAIRRAEQMETLAHVASTHPTAHYYVAGSPDFVQTVAGELARKGIKNIESDEFKGLLAEA